MCKYLEERSSEPLAKARLNASNFKKYNNMLLKRSEKSYIRYDIWVN